jgi:molecular chaperone DnaJ
MEEFEEEATKHAKGSPDSEGFFAKVKEFFDGKS